MSTNFILKQTTITNFIFILIIPIVIQFVLINSAQSLSSEILFYLTFIFFGVLYMPYFYWLNTVVCFLHKHSNEYFKLKLKTFKTSLGINIIVVFNFVFFIAYVFSFVFKGGEPNDIVFLYVGLIQFIGILSFSYTSYFVSKLIQTIEFKKTIYFSEIVGNLALYAFPPTALWIIHNKIKRIQLADSKN